MTPASPTDLNQTMLDLSEAIDQLREHAGEEERCSFCRRPQSEVNVLVPGPNDVCICDQCVARAAKLIDQRSA